MIDARIYEELRPHLFSIAYRMLGSAAEAEDVIQDAWLRTTDRDLTEVRSIRAWLSTVVTRLCLDRLKSARMTREEYVGPWLPEPVPTNHFINAEQKTIRQETITLAFLVLLEALTPAERAAFLLREVFDYEYAEIARVLETSEAACRQLVHRAKDRVAAGRPRFDSSAEQGRKIVSRFLDATQRGDLDGLQELLTRDVLYQADGGGKVAAAKRPVLGTKSVATLFLGFGRQAAAGDPKQWRIELTDVNGEAALAVFSYSSLDTIFVFSIENQRIAAIRAVRNPEKLAWISERLAVSG